MKPNDLLAQRKIMVQLIFATYRTHSFCLQTSYLLSSIHSIYKAFAPIGKLALVFCKIKSYKKICLQGEFMKLAKLLCVSAFVCIFSNLILAQAAPNLENGFKNYGSYDGSHLDTVNVMNGNLMMHIPVLPVYGQRGEFAPQYSLYLTSKAWQVHCKPNPPYGQICWWDTNNPGIMVISDAGLLVSRTLVKDFSGTGQIFYTTQGYSVTGQTGQSISLLPCPTSRWTLIPTPQYLSLWTPRVITWWYLTPTPTA
jgi:hypothetical protein